jgi:hypothetical protein
MRLQKNQLQRTGLQGTKKKPIGGRKILVAYWHGAVRDNLQKNKERQGG